MASEPINIFGPPTSALAVLRAITERYPAARVVGDGDDWESVRLDFDGLVLEVMHDRGYYQGDGWRAQQRGLAGYVGRFPLAPAVRERVGILIDALGFALATRFEPDYDDPASDDRFAVICGLTQLIDGVIFTPYGLRDPDGHFLAGAGGESDDDARWPRYAPAPPGRN